MPKKRRLFYDFFNALMSLGVFIELITEEIAAENITIKIIRFNQIVITVFNNYGKVGKLADGF